ncbi:hypothetical protein GDO81_028688, partial [Engystomops pustulosus]
GNFMALNEEVKWQIGYSDTIDAVLNSDVLDQSHFIVPVLVYSANTVPTNPEEIKEILKAARDITGTYLCGGRGDGYKVTHIVQVTPLIPV